MKSFNQFINTILVVAFIISFNQTSAQEINVGADIVSKYVWRGLEINKSPNIQPSLGFSSSGFDAGFWGSYSINNYSAADNYSYEIDAYIGYTFVTEAGDFRLLLTDYYFPNAGIKIGNFEGDGIGAHTIEIAASYSGPISILAAYNLHNDTGNNMYFEIGYSTSVGDVGLDLFVGGTPGSEDNPVYYGADSFSIINVGVKGSKIIKITDDFELPVFTSFILNPKSEIGYMIFGISF